MLEKMKNKGWSGKKILMVAGIVLVLVRIFLAMGLPIYAIGDSAYDDNLFIRLSKNIAAGEWLGNFDKKTLLKRPMFAIYLAVIHKLNLSFRLSVILFYTVSILLLIVALRYVLKEYQAKFVVFTLLLFSPVMIHSMFIQRVYRMAVIPAAILVVLATLFGLYFSVRKKEEPLYKTLLWSVAAGFGFFFFWNLREDSIWLLPFFACALMVAAVYVFADMWQERREADGSVKAFFGRRNVLRVILLLVPVAILLLGNHWIKWQNYQHYGVYTDSEMNDSEFGKLMSTMYAVESEDEYEYVNLTHNTLQKIIAVSPSLQGMEAPLEAMYDSGWVMENGEIAGGYITYAFRDALEKAGHYTNAVEKEAFCKQVNEEIKAAMADGRLATKEGLYSVSYLLGKKGANFEVLLPKFLESLKWIVTYERMDVNVLTSSGKDSTIRNFEIMTNDLAIYPPEEKFALVGYGFAKDDKEEMRFVVEREDGSKTEFVKNLSSNDVFEYYINKGIIYENARSCRFDEALAFKYEEALTLHVYLGDEEIETIDLWQAAPTMAETEEYVFCLDRVGVESTPDALSEGGGVIVLAGKLVLKVFQITAILVCMIALIAYLFLSYAGFFSRREKEQKAFIREIWLIITGVLLSFLLVTAGVTYRYAEAINSEGRDFYLCSGYVMYQIFVSLTIWVDYEYLIKPMLEGRKNKDKDNN